MSGQLMLLSPGQAAVVEAPIADSVWVERAGHYAAQAVANAERAHQRKIEKRLDKPSRTWTVREVVRSYRATTDGERRYREEADVLTLHGYRGWLETNRAGDSSGGRMLLPVRLGIPRDRGVAPTPTSRTVTWSKEVVT